MRQNDVKRRVAKHAMFLVFGTPSLFRIASAAANNVLKTPNDKENLSEREVSLLCATDRSCVRRSGQP
jgi:hypothetical protein